MSRSRRTAKDAVVIDEALTERKYNRMLNEEVR